MKFNATADQLRRLADVLDQHPIQGIPPDPGWPRSVTVAVDDGIGDVLLSGGPLSAERA